MYNDTEWYKVMLYCKEKWHVNLVLKSKQASPKNHYIPIFTETQPFSLGLVHSGWFDLKDLFPLLDRETRTRGKMNQSSGNQRFAYQQPIGQASPGQFQPMYVQAQAPPGQYAQQPVGQAIQQGQLVQPAAAQEPTLPKTTDYWNSALIAERVVEFVSCCSFFHKLLPE